MNSDFLQNYYDRNKYPTLKELVEIIQSTYEPYPYRQIEKIAEENKSVKKSKRSSRKSKSIKKRNTKSRKTSKK